ncbi:TetR/AcrR family transcriptional regulator [Mycobacterium sp. 236(2023)]|uniref:TetR/AcrR family transcriptional regulator n=1 Tax=Mycobacterium sp. 236(2023) TaxID=3038163 RepID=UPI0024157C7F|nr:TetR/AcrR family transcriptional regulator [Mycobacterium sp. 236(2023)]MDG4666692.1 TetR/AcrR family transcriptional regulator [Mycobacterium sp. 236(2023)]
MAGTAGGRPRDKQIDNAILEATRALLADGSYNDLSMERVAAHAQVGKKSLYRRWSSKAALVADAVLDAYGRDGSFEVRNTGDLAADLRSWLVEHAEFIAEPTNAALIRALISAAAARPIDNEALYELLSAPQHSGLMLRLRGAVADECLSADADLDAIANALIGTLLLRVLNATPQSNCPPTQFDGLLNALLHTDDRR